MKVTKFYLNDLEIDEPQGWADIVLAIRRDNDWKGVFFEATVNSLTFYSQAADYLVNKKEAEGIQAIVNFTAQEQCKPEGEFETVLSGRLNFGRFRQSCGIECRVTMPVEQENCIMAFRNRYDQQVDMDNNQAFDRLTVLQPYPGLGFEMELAAQETDARVQGTVGTLTPDVTTSDMGDLFGAYAWAQFFRPTYYDEKYNSITQGTLTGGSTQAFRQYNTSFETVYEDFITPQLLYDDNPKCYENGFTPSVTARLKGKIDIHSDRDDYVLVVEAYFVKFNPAADIPFPNWLENTGLSNVLQMHTIYPRQSQDNPANITRTFDFTYTNPSLSMQPGESFNAYIHVYAQRNDEPPQNMTATVTFDKETSIDIRQIRKCPPTDAQVYLVNESLARMAEAITNRCITVKSDYYGRTDSQPYPSDVDGCGSRRVLTNGLKVRQAESNKWFISMQSGFEGLRAIDNIGMGFEDNPFMPGTSWLRVEPVEYFFNSDVILSCPGIPVADRDIDESGHYSTIKIGYNLWEPKAIGGLDEFNSTREYRTSLDTVRNPLDRTSNLVAAGRVIEETRQQSFAEAGGADTTYDNETMIICVERSGSGYKVEQGNITNPANIFSPATAYNWRITPLRNLMRWFKSIINSYPNTASTASKLFFNSGTGNYTATGQLVDPYALENGVKIESKDLSATDFINAKDYLPLIRPETLTFRYPFTRKDWDSVKSKPYGVIRAQCGTGDWLEGYVEDLQWSVAQGTAEIKLRLKWQ